MIQEIIQKRKEEKIVRIKQALEKVDDKPKKTGFGGIDDAIQGGFRAGELVVLSGRSEHGKTMLGLNLLLNYVKQGYNPLLFTYEVHINSIYEMMREMGIDDDPAIYTPKKLITGAVDWIIERTEEAVEQKRSKIAIIDNLDFITSDTDSTDTRRNEINAIVRKLKNLAVEKQITVFLQVHVTKIDDERRELTMNDIADTRMIKNLADHILMMHRDLDEQKQPTGNIAKLVFAKNRMTGQSSRIYFEVENRIMKEIDKQDAELKMFTNDNLRSQN